MYDKNDHLMKTKERLDKATKAYASAQTEFIEAQRIHRDAWRELTREIH
jgi:hypothetical protein